MWRMPFRAPLDLIPSETAVLIASTAEMEAALRDHWEDATAAMHDADARRLYVEVTETLEKRASVRISESDSLPSSSWASPLTDAPISIPAA